VVEDRGHRLLPVVIEGEAGQRPGATLPGTFEGDHVETGSSDSLPDRIELLDQGVEASVEQHRAARQRSDGAQSVGRHHSVAVRNLVARCAAVAEGAVEKIAVATVDRNAGAGALGGEELGEAQIARCVAEPALRLRPVGEPSERLRGGSERPDRSRGATQLLAIGESEGVGTVELVVEKGVAVEALEADRQCRHRDRGVAHAMDPTSELA
jgi:hypothetical protein